MKNTEEISTRKLMVNALRIKRNVRIPKVDRVVVGVWGRGFKNEEKKY